MHANYAIKTIKLYGKPIRVNKVKLVHMYVGMHTPYLHSIVLIPGPPHPRYYNPLRFVLQATKARCVFLGTRLVVSYLSIVHFCMTESKIRMLWEVGSYRKDVLIALFPGPRTTFEIT